MFKLSFVSRAVLAGAALAALGAGAQAQQHELGHAMDTNTASRSDSGRPMESLSLNYTKITYSTPAQSAGSASGGGTGKVSYSDLHATTRIGKSPATAKEGAAK